MGVTVAIKRVIVGVADASIVIVRVRHVGKDSRNLDVWKGERKLARKKEIPGRGERRGSLSKGWWGTSR